MTKTRTKAWKKPPVTYFMTTSKDLSVKSTKTKEMPKLPSIRTATSSSFSSTTTTIIVPTIYYLCLSLSSQVLSRK